MQVSDPNHPVIPQQIVKDFQAAIGSFCKGIGSAEPKDLKKLSNSIMHEDVNSTIAMPVEAVWKMLEVYEALDSFQKNVAINSRK